MNSSNQFQNFNEYKENYNMNNQSNNGFNVLKEHRFHGSQPNGANFINDHVNPKSSEIYHANVQEGFSVNYIEFENISVIAQNDQLDSYFEHINSKFKSGNWMAVFDAINDLRSLNKSFPQYANEIFRMFGEYILKVSESTKPCLNKNLLAFFNEVLQQAPQSQLDSKVIDKLLVILIKKINSTNSNIVGLGEVCLKTLIENCANEKVTMTLCHHSVHKNINISKVAFHALGVVLDMLKDKISQLGDECFRMVFMTLSFNLNSKSTNNKSLSKTILRFLYEQLGQSFVDYLEYIVKNEYLSEEDKRAIAKVVTNSKTNFKERSNYIRCEMSRRKSEKPRVNAQMNYQNHLGGNYGHM